MYLQEQHYLTFHLDFGVKVTQKFAQYLLHHVTYAATKFEVARFNRLGGDTFTRKYYLTFDLDLWVKVTQNIAKLPLHHVSYAATKFEVARPYSLGGDAFT